MKVLLYGHKGFIGTYMHALFDELGHEVVCTKTRVNNTTDVENDIKQHRPTHIMSCTGRTHGGEYNTIDYLEQDGKLVDNLRDNLFGPLVLASLSKKYGVHCTIIGTGCIYTSNYDSNGTPTDKFTETCEPNFVGSSYSIVKGYTDRLLRCHGNDHVLNLRIRMPIMNYPNKRCFISKIVAYEKICSIPNSMSYLPSLFPIAVDMMENGVEGTFNFVNPGVVSHNQILKLYEQHVDPTHTTQNFSEEEMLKILAAARSNNELDTQKLQSLYPNVPTIDEAIGDAIRGYANQKNVNQS